MSLQALAEGQITECIASIHENVLVFDQPIAAFLRARLRDAFSARAPTSATKTKTRACTHHARPFTDDIRRQRSDKELEFPPNVSQKHTEQVPDADLLPGSSSSCSSSANIDDPFLPSPLPKRSHGIDWTLASLAQSLLANARLLTGQASARQQPLIIRSMFIESVALMLQSLPQDLTDVEYERVYESLPNCADWRISWNRGAGELQCKSKKSLFRRSIGQLFVLIAILLAFIIPLAVSMAKWCYQQERKHKVTNKLLAWGLRGLNSVGEKFFDVKDAIHTIQSGRLGAAWSSAMAYTIDGVNSALNSVVMYTVDGVGGGLWDGTTQVLGTALAARTESQKL